MRRHVAMWRWCEQQQQQQHWASIRIPCWIPAAAWAGTMASHAAPAAAAGARCQRRQQLPRSHVRCCALTAACAQLSHAPLLPAHQVSRSLSCPCLPPTCARRTLLAAEKKAQIKHDEWAKIYKYHIEEGKAKGEAVGWGAL